MFTLITGLGGFEDRPVLSADIDIKVSENLDRALLEMAVGENCEKILVDLNGDIEIVVDPSIPGTLLTVKDHFFYRWPFSANHVIITVRTEEQKKAWEETIEKAREKFKELKKPRDILPPRMPW